MPQNAYSNSANLITTEISHSQYIPIEPTYIDEREQLKYEKISFNQLVTATIIFVLCVILFTWIDHILKSSG
jgi:hypothetical protein